MASLPFLLGSAAGAAALWLLVVRPMQRRTAALHSVLDGLVSDIDSWTRDGRPRLTDGEGSGCAD